MGWTSEDWMSQVEDGRSVTELTIPGTHNSWATQENLLKESPTGGLISIAWVMCQLRDLYQQLHLGVRYVDLRVGQDMSMCHDKFLLDGKIWDAIDVVSNFLKDHPRETVLVSVKSESECDEEVLAEFIEKRWREAGWYSRNTWPRLGEVRGKCVLLRRFGGDNRMHGNLGIAWNLYGNQTSTNKDAPWEQQDDGVASGLDQIDRWHRAADHIRDVAKKPGDNGVMYFSTLADNCATIPPIKYAEFMNEDDNFPFTMRDITIQPTKQRLGIICFDFYDINANHGTPVMEKNFPRDTTA